MTQRKSTKQQQPLYRNSKASRNYTMEAPYRLQNLDYLVHGQTFSQEVPTTDEAVMRELDKISHQRCGGGRRIFRHSTGE